MKRIDFETSDRDAASEAIEGAFGFRARFSGRRIGFRQHTLEVRDVSYTELGFGADLRTDVDANPNVVLAEVVQGRYTIRRGREKADLSHGGLFMLPTGDSMRVELDHTVTRTFNLGPVAGLRRIALQADPTADRVDLSRIQPRSRDAARYLRETLVVYRRNFLREGADVGSLAAQEAARHLRLTAMAVFELVSPVRHDVPETVIIRRARDHVAAHLAEPMTVTDLAGAAGTSVRSVQMAFRRELGQTPLEYVRNARLLAAREELRRAARSATPLTVAQVAARWGFSNAGRFSSLYLERFAEYPSNTLRNA